MTGRWFHRNINGIEAEKLLGEFGQDGSFLIRPSQSTVNSYTLSVRCKDLCKHIKIQNNGDCGYEIGEGGDKFATLAELVEHFIMKDTLRDKIDGTILVLKYPLNSKEPTNERYFHGTISGAEAASLLLEKGKPGSYLVRESRSNPQNYVLCIRCENSKVVHLIINYSRKGYTMQNFNKYFPTLDEFINECIKMCPIVDVKDNVVYLKQPLNCSRVNAINFSIRVSELEYDNRFNNKNGFSEEFEALQQADGAISHKRTEGDKLENKSKNRFKTILPFDHNRIKLKKTKIPGINEDDSDYINANCIKSEDSFGKIYIATQGPLVNTIYDFWLMVLQEECQIILMVTPELEKSKVKCARYWPDSTDKFSDEVVGVYKDIKVKLAKDPIEHTDFIVREFLVSRNDNSLPRTVYHLQYTTWSDHEVPLNIQGTLDYLDYTNRLYNEIGLKKPIIVHCSAGIGRTGTVIAIDMVIDKIKTYGLQCDIDIYKTACGLRSQRSGLIQTEIQYQYVYMVVKKYIETHYQYILSKNSRS